MDDKNDLFISGLLCGDDEDEMDDDEDMTVVLGDVLVDESIESFSRLLLDVVVCDVGLELLAVCCC